MAHNLIIKPRAERDLEGLPRDLAATVDAAVVALADEPRPRGAKKLAGAEDLWRVRVGDYRILYSIDHAQAVVTVARIRHRREAYR
jgi:mRNA interferase RelE/StbE